MALDLKALVISKRFNGIRCTNHPLKAAVSPGERAGRRGGGDALHQPPPAGCSELRGEGREEGAGLNQLPVISGQPAVLCECVTAITRPGSQLCCCLCPCHRTRPTDSSTATAPCPADGEWVVCGSEDGRAFVWDFATTTPTPLPQLSLGTGPVSCVAWSYSFHVVAACSFSHDAPVKVLGFDPSVRPVAVNATGEQPAASILRVKVRGGGGGGVQASQWCMVDGAALLSLSLTQLLALALTPGCMWPACAGQPEAGAYLRAAAAPDAAAHPGAAGRHAHVRTAQVSEPMHTSLPACLPASAALGDLPGV